MNILVDALLIFITFILHSVLFPHLTVAGIAPNLFAILISSIGFMRGEKEGMLAGFAAGLLLDVFWGPVIGFYALLYTVLGFLNGKFCGFFFPEEIKLPAGLIALSDFTLSITIYIFMFLLTGNFKFGISFGGIIIGEFIYTLIISLVFYPALLGVNMLLDKYHSRSIDR